MELFSDVKNNLTYLEIFAGAGGLSEGFLRNNFIPIAHIEMDKYASLTLKTRLAYYFIKKSGRYELYSDYITQKITREEFYNLIPDNILKSVITAEIKEETLSFLFNEIEKIMYNRGISRINVLVGGPPCQAYSVIGRARDPYKKQNDKRNYLYKLYAKFLEKFEPDVFVFENVPGLLSAGGGKLWEDVKRYFKNAGYKVDYRMLNAYSFGVLQNRKRIIVIGWRLDIDSKYPVLTEENLSEEFKVRDIFDDLPPLLPGERIYYGKYIKPPSKYLKKYQIRDENDVLTLHLARKHNQRDRLIYKFYIEKWLSERRRPEYDELPEDLKTHKNRKVFRDRFKVVSPDLPYSQTVVAHLAKDGHYFIHPDINQLRSISVREAARLQSFPDNFYFEGPMTAMFRQIGNAVPPLMAEKIAEKIKEIIG